MAPPLPPSRGVAKGELQRLAAAGPDVVAELLGANRPSGFLVQPRRRRDLARLLEAARRWRRRDIRDLVHIGIGGSSLGAEMLWRTFSHPRHNLLPDGRRSGPRVHFADNVDPQTVAALLDVVDLDRCMLHVVSKSGSTVEVLALFQLFRDALARRSGAGGENPWTRCVAITTGRGELREFALHHDIEVLDFPEELGGRFSVLSSSGLLTPAISGVPVAEVVRGARQMLIRALRGGATRNPAAMAAAVAHTAAAERGLPIQVLMPYADCLEPMARWYVQLVAESLGKHRVGEGAPTAPGTAGVGVTPLAARGATDQHSQVQLFVDGPADKLFILVSIDEMGEALCMPRLAEGEPGAYLSEHPLERLLHAEREGTVAALARAQRPLIEWRMPTADPAIFGQLLLALELQTAIHARLLGVDAYDQPGVEAGKVAAFAWLGRPGYAEDYERIRTARPPRVEL